MIFSENRFRFSGSCSANVKRLAAVAARVRPRLLNRIEDGAHAVNIGARRDDLRSLHGLVQVRIGLQMVDQADIRIDGIADAPVAKILDLPKIPGCGRRRDGEDGEKAGKTAAKCEYPLHRSAPKPWRMIARDVAQGNPPLGGRARL